MTGPEYFGFGTIVSLPEVLKVCSFHGPSTTVQIGLVAYVAVALACAVRKLNTALQLAALVWQPPLPALAPVLVTSQAIGIGQISASWL